MRNNFMIVPAILGGLLLGSTLHVVEVTIKLSELKKQLIEYGYARYNPTNGKFELIKPQGK